MSKDCFEATRGPAAIIGYCLIWHGWKGRSIGWDSVPMMVGG